jgi:hypothetical protein
MPGARHARLVMTMVAVIIIFGMLAGMMPTTGTVTPN